MSVLSLALSMLLLQEDRGLFNRRQPTSEAKPIQTMEARVRDAGYHPAPGLSAVLTPGAIVFRNDGALFLSREDCFPDAAVHEGVAVLPESAKALSGSLQVSVGLVGKLLGGKVNATANHTATIAFQDLTVRSVATGALTPSQPCLDRLNQNRAAGIGLDAYLMITEVLQAEGVTVQAQTASDAAAGSAQSDLARLANDVDASVSISQASANGFTATGRVTLGYKCKLMVGHQADGDVENAGSLSACTGFGPTPVATP